MEGLFYVALITSLMAGLGANYESDLKKIIALSTLSQLGLIIGAVAMGAVVFAFCHLLTHALFKALLFMCAGRIIHVIGGHQDIRIIGGIISLVPVSAVCFNIANLALCGVPFLAGFYSKDLILEFGIGENYNFFMLGVLFLATGLTCSYSFRVS
jgi:NADH-ubiquinone oxidoreductase chain 5